MKILYQFEYNNNHWFTWVSTTLDKYLSTMETPSLHIQYTRIPTFDQGKFQFFHVHMTLLQLLRFSKYAQSQSHHSHFKFCVDGRDSWT